MAKAPAVETTQRSTTLPISPGSRSTFNWTDVDFSKKANCGWHKCFWPSISDNNTGYLVASRTKLYRMKKAVDTVLDLETKYGINHFHKALTKDTVADEFGDFLNSLVHQPARESKGQAAKPVFVEKHKKSTLPDLRLAIETVRMAPDNVLFFGETNSNLLLVIEQLSAFREQIPDKDAYSWMLFQHYKKLKDIFAVKPEIALDFQALVDSEGKLYFIDLDGHVNLERKLRKDQIQCRAKRALDLFIDVMLNLTDTKEIQVEKRPACL
uniref:Uncharacterized protein n=1 Tax=Amphora coffeiformis TaxID=265554 RepID=A0A6S8MZI5_9STRA